MPSGFGNKEFWRLFYGVGFLVLILVSLGIAEVVQLAGPFIVRAYLFSIQRLGGQNTEVVIGVAVLISGIAAFFFKLKHQRAYGAVEVLFGGVAAVVTARQMKAATNWTPQITALIGAVYIVSRGLNNISDGFKVIKKVTGKPWEEIREETERPH
jgi:hypothetical protein